MFHSVSLCMYHSYHSVCITLYASICRRSLLLLLPGGSRPPVSHWLQMAPEAAGQARYDTAILQPRRVDIDVAELPQTKAGQARTSEQDVLRGVRLFAADCALRSRAPLVRTPRAGRRGETDGGLLYRPSCPPPRIRRSISTWPPRVG